MVSDVCMMKVQKRENHEWRRVPDKEQMDMKEREKSKK